MNISTMKIKYCNLKSGTLIVVEHRFCMSQNPKKKKKRMIWYLFKYERKYERKNLEFFTCSWENNFGNVCPSLIEKIGFLLFKKNRSHFQDKSKFFVQTFSVLKFSENIV